MMLRTLAMIAFAVCATTAQADQHAKVTMPADFAKLEKLIGTWEGTTQKGDKEETVRVEYQMTAGGTALVEKLFPGTPHEMVSIYHADGSKVAMTHFCMLGNQPKMTLTKADDKTLTFELAKTTGLKSTKEPHMHGLTITMMGDNQMKHEWSMWEKGKQKDTTTFVLTKK